MNVISKTIPVNTEGNGDVVDITDPLLSCVYESIVQAGLVTVFTPSATSGITTLEYETGCVNDLQRLFDQIIPPDQPYAHNQRWGDGNGHSHARAALTKPSLTIPIINGKLTLGTWQSVVLVDFDNRPRTRELIVQILGE